MKAELANSNRIDVLGNSRHFSALQVAASALKYWRRKIGYFSMFMALPAALSTQPRDVLADRSDTRTTPLPIDGRSGRLRARDGTSCTKPELLRRQSNFLLPHQRGSLGLVSALAGNDSCPGMPIPPGDYTAASPFTDTGDTTGASNTVALIGGLCGVYYYYYVAAHGPDHVYSFILTGRGAAPQIRVSTTTPGYSPMVYVLNSRWHPICPTGPAANAGNCLAVGYGGGGDPAVIKDDAANSLPLNTPLYLFVDSQGNGADSSGPYTLSLQDFTISNQRRTSYDFDPDAKADLALYRPSNNVWYQLRSSQGFSAMEFGVNSDKQTPADYDGDGKTGVAVFRPSNGTWYISGTSDGFYTRQWGQDGDLPVPADYDADGKADVAVYRPANGTWYVVNSRTGISTLQFGTAEDIPMPYDFYGGDGRADFVVYRPSTNLWYFKVPYEQGFFTASHGSGTDIRLPADYDGDGYADISLYRPETGVWSLWLSQNGLVTRTWGEPGDIPVPADYDGDGTFDIAVYRPSNGTWYLWRSTAGIAIMQFGTAEDRPVAAMLRF